MLARLNDLGVRLGYYFTAVPGLFYSGDLPSHHLDIVSLGTTEHRVGNFRIRPIAPVENSLPEWLVTLPPRVELVHCDVEQMRDALVPNA